MINREHLIELIAKYLVVSGYLRADNYKTYSIKELLKVCSIYKINVSEKVS